MDNKLKYMLERNSHIFQNQSYFDNLEIVVKHYRNQYFQVAKIAPGQEIPAFYDAMEEEEITTIKKTESFSCKKGCSFCCHKEVKLYPKEALYIAKRCEEAGIKIDKKYLQRQANTPQKELFRKGHSACVFLKDNACSIYEFRPLACRAYLVKSDPAKCNIALGRQEVINCTTPIMTAIMLGPGVSGELKPMAKMLLPYSK